MDKPTSLEMMSKPFDWIEIPGGEGILKTNKANHTLDIPKESYRIAKYPVTNRQYGHFVELDGYSTDKWWTKQGIEAREKYQWTEPRYWKEEDFAGADKPVVGISWYEAVAFCLWLSDVTGEWIMLPTEAQWQYAAQGTDGRIYPWGDILRGNECKNYGIIDEGVGLTRPVNYYEGIGDSAFGVVDMAGNVWEWCLTNPWFVKSSDFDTDGRKRVIRGGSWDDYETVIFQCDYHVPKLSHEADNNLGFRIARL